MRKILPAIAIALVAATAPAVAQQKSSAETRAMERASAMEKEIVAAFNKKDPAALAALYTRNGLLVGPDGRVASGRAAIEAYYANTFKAWGDFKFDGEVKEAHAIGNGIWAILTSSVDGNGPNGPVKLRSHVAQIFVPVGKEWKARMASVGADVAPPGAPAQ